MVTLVPDLMVDAGLHLSLTEVVGGGRGGGKHPGDHGDVRDEEQLLVHNRSHPGYPPSQASGGQCHEHVMSQNLHLYCAV